MRFFSVFLTAFAMSCSQTALAGDMEFSLQREDLRPVSDLIEHIYADGDLVEGTTERFLAFVRDHNVTEQAIVIFNSGGGSLVEGMRLGEAMRPFRFRTNVGKQANKPMEIAPGECMSACVFSYLGGEYRYLDDGSAIGIHQFRFTKDFTSDLTAAVSQGLSGRIVEYLKRSRADPNLFALMTKTLPNEMHIVPRKELDKLRVVTGDVFSEDWTFEAREGKAYLKADQITWRGQNKLLFFCAEHRGRKALHLMFLAELPDRESILRETRAIVIFVDDKPIIVPKVMVTNKPARAGGDYLSWTIGVTKEMASAFRAIERIGGGLSLSNLDMFAGFRGINVGTGREKLDRFLTDCSQENASARPVQSGERTAQLNQGDKSSTAYPRGQSDAASTGRRVTPLTSDEPRPERLAQLLGTLRVLTDRCKITGNPNVLDAAVRRAGFELTEFVPGGRFWPYTRRAMDARFEMIATLGLGKACNTMNETIQATLPGY